MKLPCTFPAAKAASDANSVKMGALSAGPSPNTRAINVFYVHKINSLIHVCGAKSLQTPLLWQGQGKLDELRAAATAREKQR